MNTDECPHGLTPDTCTPCIHGPQVAGYRKARPKGYPRQAVGPRPAERAGMLGVDPRYTSTEHRVDYDERQYASRWQDRRWSRKATRREETRPPKAVPQPRGTATPYRRGKGRVR